MKNEKLPWTQDIEALQQLEEHYGALNRRHMLSEGIIERLRNGDITRDIVTAAEKKAAAPRRRRVGAHSHLYGK